MRKLLATPSDTRIGSRLLDWGDPYFASLKAAYTLAGATGFRKDEILRLTRGNLMWEIDGIFFADPTPTQLGSLKPDRDRAVI
jgi:integrase